MARRLIASRPGTSSEAAINKGLSCWSGSSENSWREGVAQDLAARSCDQRIDVRPDCGDTRRRTRIYFSNRKAKIAPCSLRIQRVVTNRDLTLPPAVGLTLDRARLRHRSRACSAPAGLAPATPPVCRRAIRPAVAARLAPAPAAAPRAEDCPAGFPAAVRLDGPASEAG